jgi:uncharacterized phage-associated protein
MALTTAKDAGHFIIGFCREHGDSISNLKLQKLLYYAQAWSLAILDKPLFNDEIEAWVHGPVVPSVWREFRPWSWQPIMQKISKPEISARVERHLKEVIAAYGHLSAYQLETLTHEEKPWRNARKGIPNDVSCNEVISTTDMKKFYRARLSNGN